MWFKGSVVILSRHLCVTLESLFGSPSGTFRFSAVLVRYSVKYAWHLWCQTTNFFIHWRQQVHMHCRRGILFTSLWNWKRKAQEDKSKTTRQPLLLFRSCCFLWKAFGMQPPLFFVQMGRAMTQIQNQKTAPVLNGWTVRAHVRTPKNTQNSCIKVSFFSKLIHIWVFGCVAGNQPEATICRSLRDKVAVKRKTLNWKRLTDNQWIATATYRQVRHSVAARCARD